MQAALGEIYLSNGDQARAEQLLREAVASQRAYGRDSADLATRLETLGRLLLGLQQFAGAESAGTEARAIRAKLTPGVIDEEASKTLGAAFMETEKYAEAEQIFRELVAMQRRQSKESISTSALILLGEDLRRQGRNEEASSLFEEELARLEAKPAMDSAGLASVYSYLGAAQLMMGHGALADSLMRKAYDMYASVRPMMYQHVGRGTVLANRAEIAARAGNDVAAAPLADSARAMWKGALRPGDPRWAALARIDALLLRDHHQPAAAVARLVAMLDTLRSMPHPNLYAYRRTEATLADVYDRWGQPDSAAAHRALARAGAPLAVTTLAKK
jgi:tetratricopeptide (TPR) repeat protein